MQIHGMQCPHPTGLKKYFRRSNEDGAEVEGQTHGEKKKGIQLFSYLILLSLNCPYNLQKHMSHIAKHTYETT